MKIAVEKSDIISAWNSADELEQDLECSISPFALELQSWKERIAFIKSALDPYFKDSDLSESQLNGLD